METEYIILLLSFFIIAMVYASVGFGGGSSYLALLAQPVFTLLPDVIRPTALLCNIIVVTGGTIIFYREGKIKLKEVWPFIVMSIPMAYVGGLWKLDNHTFFVLLGTTLFVAAVALWLKPQNTAAENRYNKHSINIILGGGIGFLSGLISIGGGIFLSPILHFINWSEAKKISALASLFIFVNSVSGLLGQLHQQATIEWQFIWPLLLGVLVGGQIGSRLGAKKFNPLYVKRITAVLIFLAGLKILFDWI